MWWLQCLVLLASVLRPTAAHFNVWNIEKGVVCSDNRWTANDLKETRLKYCNIRPDLRSLKNTSHHFRATLYSVQGIHVYLLPLSQHYSTSKTSDSDYYMTVDLYCNYYNVVKVDGLDPGILAPIK